LGPAGTGPDDWKLRYTQGGPTASGAFVTGAYRFGREVAYTQIEVSDNAGQSVTGDCVGDSYV
jgi:hypothetical protein